MMGELKISSHLSLRTVAIVGITLLALALGGSTDIVGASGDRPAGGPRHPHFSPARRAGAPCPTLVLLAFPGRGLVPPSPGAGWAHARMAPPSDGDLHASLGDLRTPQPWLTLQVVRPRSFSGSSGPTTSSPRNGARRRNPRPLRLLVAGIILLAAASTASYLTGYRIPGWNQEQNRGWFPNRNQTADVLALCGIVNYVVAFKRLRKKRMERLPWLAGLGIIGGALVISYSRAGIADVFRRDQPLASRLALSPRGKARAWPSGCPRLYCLLSLFLLFGGDTLDRFLPVPNPIIRMRSTTGS